MGVIENRINDTKLVKDIEQINNNLSTLSYGTESGCTNLWNEQWEVGGFSTTDGTPFEFTNRIRTVDFIKVKPNTSYYVVGSVFLFKYTENKEFIGFTTYTNTTFTTPSNCEYVNFSSVPPYGTVYNNDIALIEGTIGTYEPYIESTKMLTNDVTSIKNDLSDNFQIGEYVLNGDQTLSSKSTITIDIPFDKAFSSVPKVVLSLSIAEDPNVFINTYTVATDKVRVVLYNNATYDIVLNNSNRKIMWFAKI